MEELVLKIKNEMEIFLKNVSLQMEKDNKAAGRRARNSSLEIPKLLKEFRKVSIESSKNNG